MNLLEEATDCLKCDSIIEISDATTERRSHPGARKIG